MSTESTTFCWILLSSLQKLNEITEEMNSSLHEEDENFLALEFDFNIVLER